jgi:alkylhydroperoxidase family enzyme
VHAADARKAGQGERRLATVAVWRETPLFNDRKRVQARFTPTELVDQTLPANTIHAWNRFAIAFRMLPA